MLIAGLDQPVPPTDLTSYVYDQWVVLRSAAWLLGHPRLHLPDDINLAVQQVYGEWEPPGPAPLLDAITAARPDHQAEQQWMQQWANQAALPEPPIWGIHQHRPLLSDEDAESGAVRFGTRLGDPSITVVPVAQQHLDNLPAHAYVLAGHYLRISHRKLIAQVQNTPIPIGWRDVPGLRHHLPLVVDNDGNGPGCRLDPVLGLIIGTSGGAIP